MTDQLTLAAALPATPAAAAGLLEPLLRQAAGAGSEPVSLTLDYGRPGLAGEPVTVEAVLERATRTLAFVHGRVLAGAEVLAAAQAVFRRPLQAPDAH